MTRLVVLGAAAAALLALGCANSLVFATRTSTGIKITPVKNDQSEIALGYDRQEIAIFPVAQEPGEGPPGGAYRLFARFFMTNAWPIVDLAGNLPPGLRIHSVIAAGDAAECVAEVVGEEPDACEDGMP